MYIANVTFCEFSHNIFTFSVLFIYLFPALPEEKATGPINHRTGGPVLFFCYGFSLFTSSLRTSTVVEPAALPVASNSS